MSNPHQQLDGHQKLPVLPKLTMRIAIHDYAGFPFTLDLSRELACRGHKILYLFTMASGGPKANFEEAKKNDFQLYNIFLSNINKDKFSKRWLQERRYGDLAINKLKLWKPDIVVSANTPLEAQRKIINWAEKHHISSVFWLQDLLSVAAESIVSKNFKSLGMFPAKYFRKLEVNALRKADHIVSITDDFISILKTWGVDTNKVSIITNWAPVEDIPVLPRKNFFSDQHGLNDKFVILYSGTLGMKQDPGLIVKTASILAEDKEILFLIATDDRGHGYLKKELGQTKLPNMIQIPLQSFKVFPYMLASADISLAVLKNSASLYCVPSKIWSAFCASKPSVVIVNRGNLTGRITSEIQAGIVVKPGSVHECVAAIKYLKENKEERERLGRNGRCYAESEFRISKITDTFEAIFQRIRPNSSDYFTRASKVLR